MSTDKFKALVHYVIHECQDQPSKLGAVRLNKVLWHTDVLSYLANGVPVTGATYVKRQKGPVPKTILRTLEALEGSGEILIKQPEHQYDPRKYISLRSPPIDMLSDEERSLASKLIELLCGYSANEVSEMTHDSVWGAAMEGEEIPLHAVLASGSGEVTDDLRLWAQGIIDGIEGVRD